MLYETAKKVQTEKLALIDNTNDLRSHSCSFGINLVSIRASSVVPLLPKAVSWFGLFFAISYSKPALAPLML